MAPSALWANEKPARSEDAATAEAWGAGFSGECLMAPSALWANEKPARGEDAATAEAWGAGFQGSGCAGQMAFQPPRFGLWPADRGEQ
jgi:hypothetical protein